MSPLIPPGTRVRTRPGLIDEHERRPPDTWERWGLRQMVCRRSNAEGVVEMWNESRRAYLVRHDDDHAGVYSPDELDPIARGPHGGPCRW